MPLNLKAGVVKHPREGEVVLNDAYREMAAHYGSAVLPARVATPRDYRQEMFNGNSGP